MESPSLGLPRVRQYGLSKAAGRAEKKDSAMHHEAVKPFLNRRLYNDFFAHFFPPFDTERDRHKLFATCLKLYYTSLFRNVNHPKG